MVIVYFTITRRTVNSDCICIIIERISIYSVIIDFKTICRYAKSIHKVESTSTDFIIGHYNIITHNWLISIEIVRISSETYSVNGIIKSRSIFSMPYKHVVVNEIHTITVIESNTFRLDSWFIGIRIIVYIYGRQSNVKFVSLNQYISCRNFIIFITTYTNRIISDSTVCSSDISNCVVDKT